MSNTKKCDESGMCRFLEMYVTDGGKGLRTVQTIKLDPAPDELETKWRGVAYHPTARDRGIIINFCPWCGGKPGDLANRTTTPKGAS